MAESCGAKVKNFVIDGELMSGTESETSAPAVTNSDNLPEWLDASVDEEAGQRGSRIRKHSGQYGLGHDRVPSDMVMGSSVSEFGGLWDSHLELRFRHDWAIAFASLLWLLSEGGGEVLSFRSASIRRSSSASLAERSRGGSKPRERRASSRRSFDTTSLERAIGTACGR